MGLYYEQDYYGVKFLDKNNTELYKTIYYEKMNKEDVEKVKMLCPVIIYKNLKNKFKDINIFNKVRAGDLQNYQISYNPGQINKQNFDFQTRP